MKKLLKTTSIYLIGNTLSKLISFLLLPIYTSYLLPEDFGKYDVIIAYLNIFVLVIFVEIGSSLLRFILDKNYINKKDTIITNSYAIFLFSIIIYTVSFIIIATFVKVDFIIYIYLYGLMSGMIKFYGYIARGLGKNTSFMLSGLLNALILGALNIILLVFCSFGYEVLFISAIIGGFAQVIFLELSTKSLKAITLNTLNFKLIKKILKFGIPLSINYVSIWFLSSYNKIAISNLLGFYENGIYAITSKFTMILSLVSLSFLFAWQELAFSKDTSTEKDLFFFTNAIKRYLRIITLTCIPILSIIWIVFPYMVSSEYNDALDYIPLAIVAVAISLINGFLGSIFGSMMKTKYIFISTTIGAIVNVILCFVLIPYFGINGASLALASGFLVSVLFRFYFLSKFIILKINLYEQFVQIVLLFLYILVYFRLNFTNHVIILISSIGILILWNINDLKDVIRKVSKHG